MQLCVLASGSSGNCIYVASGATRVLVDLGIGWRTLRPRLAELAVPGDGIQAVLFTHEHTDHCSGLPGFVRQNPQARLLANESTGAGIESGTSARDVTWDIFETGQPFTIGSLSIQSFAVPHDTGDPVAYVISDGAHRVGIATDFGVSTPVVRRHLTECDALVLESNHDVEMVKACSRPWSVKQRILGRQGHLSNEQSAHLLREVAGPRLRSVFLAHLSAECNTPDLAEAAARQALRDLDRRDVCIYRTHRDQPSVRLVLGEGEMVT